MERIALVACVKEKLKQSTSAVKMYTEESFKLWIRDAKARNVDHIYILSGKYGLLELDEIIEPYDLNLSHQDASYIVNWKNNVILRLKAMHQLTDTHAIIYANKLYYEGLHHHFNSYEIPFQID